MRKPQARMTAAAVHYDGPSLADLVPPPGSRELYEAIRRSLTGIATEADKDLLWERSYDARHVMVAHKVDVTRIAVAMRDAHSQRYQKARRDPNGMDAWHAWDAGWANARADLVTYLAALDAALARSKAHNGGQAWPLREQVEDLSRQVAELRAELRAMKESTRA